MQEEKRFSVIIIDYFSVEDTFSYIAHLLSKTKHSNLLDFIVVDNTNGKWFINYSAEHSIHYASENFEYNGANYKVYCPQTALTANIKWLVAQNNLGYAKGNNLGIALQNKFYQNPYLVISNNDLEVIGDEFDWLVFDQYFKENADCAVIGPRIIGKNGNPQSPCKQNSFANLMIFPFYNRLLGGCLNQKLTSVLQNCPTGKVYWVSGCFCVADAQRLQQAGNYDEATFLYAEEMILSERLKQVGYSMHYLPGLGMIHYQSKVVNSTLTRKDIDLITIRSLGHYFTQYRKKSLLHVKIAVINYYFYTVLNTLRSAMRSIYHKIK